MAQLKDKIASENEGQLRELQQLIKLRDNQMHRLFGSAASAPPTVYPSVYPSVCPSTHPSGHASPRPASAQSEPFGAGAERPHRPPSRPASGLDLPTRQPSARTAAGHNVERSTLDRLSSERHSARTARGTARGGAPTVTMHCIPRLGQQPFVVSDASAGAAAFTPYHMAQHAMGRAAAAAAARPATAMVAGRPRCLDAQVGPRRCGDSTHA